jgi:ribose transport system substrate-binding protein
MEYFSQGVGHGKGRRRKFAAASMASFALLLGGGAAALASTARTASAKPVIAFSQSFSSNSWQQLNNKGAQEVAATLKSEGKISKYIFVNANNSVSTQISQIDALILEHVNTIMVDPTSSSALNGVINKAIAAGIKVLIVTDGPVTTDKPYELEADLYGYNEQLAQYIVNRLHGKGNVLQVRGVAGTGGDQDEYNGSASVFKKYPGIKIVGTVYGDWDEPNAESAVSSELPSLPTVNAVMQQGGSGLGIAESFQSAGRPVPLIVMGNRSEELSWWAAENKKDGYTTESISTNPGMGGAGIYVSYELAMGVKVPKWMVMPNLEITQSMLSQYAHMPTGTVAWKVFPLSWVKQNLLTQNSAAAEKTITGS